MKLTQKLLDLLHRVFDKDPGRFLALRLRYDGQMQWRVEDGTLYTTVTGGTGSALQVTLGDFTLFGLAEHLGQQDGYSIEYVETGSRAALSARVLMDGSGDQDESNGDHLRGYTSIVWAYLEAMSVELDAARAQILQALRQMNVQTAEGDWLDELGGYYAVPRIVGESDPLYAQRIIAEVLRPKGNNVAMEIAISEAIGGGGVTVADVPTGTGFPVHDSTLSYDGGAVYQTSGVLSFGLFDVDFDLPLDADLDIAPYVARVREVVNRLRDAGTHLRAIKFAATLDDTAAAPADLFSLLQATSSLTDTVDAQSDLFAALSAALDQMQDAVAAPSDTASLSLSPAMTYSGLRAHNGHVNYDSGEVVAEAL